MTLPGKNLPTYKNSSKKVIYTFSVYWEHLWRSLISNRLLCNFTEITLQHGCSPVNFLYIFRAPFSKNSSERLLPLIWFLVILETHLCKNCQCLVFLSTCFILCTKKVDKMEITWRPDYMERIPDCLYGFLQKASVKFSKTRKIRK